MKIDGLSFIQVSLLVGPDGTNLTIESVIILSYKTHLWIETLLNSELTNGKKV